MQHRFYALWAINAALDEERLCRQLDEMRAFGLDGVVFHPRFYPGLPPYLGEDYLHVLSRTILHAKSIGLDFWLYDEDGWPSGTVGGQLLHQHPDDAQQWADLVTDESADCLGQFTRDGKTWFIARRIGAGVDYLNPEMARHFLEMTHERYRTGLSAEAWAHVSTIFTDEPEFGLGHAYDQLSPHGAIPWTSRLPELFEARYGEPLAAALPLIFFDGEGADVARIRFWELLTDLFNDAYTRPINDWCRDHGKRFTGHVKGEEHPLFQVPMVGSCTSFYRAIGLPAIDALERFPSNDFYPRQASSAAEQFGDGRCMAECFGGAGWGAGPNDLERYLLWLGRLGVTDFVLHLWQYRLDSHAIRDWPTSLPNHVSWGGVFPQILDNVKAELAQRQPVVDTLVMTPHRGVMAAYSPAELRHMNIHNAASYAMTGAGRINDKFMDVVQSFTSPPHYTDERTAESGSVQDRQFVIGNKRYGRVLIADGCRLNDSTRRQLARLEVDPPQPAPAVHGPTAAAPGGRVVRPRWTISAGQMNDFPPDAVADGGGGWAAAFECADPIEVEIVFADDVTDVRVDGVACPTESNGNGTVARPAGPLAIGNHQVTFHSISNSDGASLWVHGRFLVRPNVPFRDGPNRTITTSGGFTLHQSAPGHFKGLAAAGYAFCRSSVEVTAAVSDVGHATTLCVDAPGADVVEVEVDGVIPVAIYHPDQAVTLPHQGVTTIRLRLHASAFNAFGPRHYFAGDHFVISPDQFAGRRNFADPPGAPESTSVDATFVRDIAAPVLTLC